MSESDTPTSKDVLNSLNLLRSNDPADRKRAIAILAPLRDDPRVQQVFEHLYQNDPDSQVRELAWTAINQAGPSIPAPAPAPPPQAPRADEAAPAAPRKAGQRAPKPDTSRVFLLNPANASLIARESQRRRARGPGGCVWLVMALVLMAVAALLASMVVPGWIDWNRLNQDGVTTDGTVIGRRVDNEEYRGRQYFVRYTFNVPLAAPDGVQVEGEQAVSSRAYAALAEGSAVTVTYLLDDPDVSRIDQDDPRDEERAWITALAVALAALAIIALGMAFRRRPQPAGQLIKGQVVTCTGQVDAEGDFTLKLRYRFRSPGGKMIVRQAAQIRNDMKTTRLPEPGTPVAIYYRSDRSYRLL